MIINAKDTFVLEKRLMFRFQGHQMAQRPKKIRINLDITKFYLGMRDILDFRFEAFFERGGLND